MDYITKPVLFLALNIVVMIYAIIITKKSNLHSDTKTLLYVMSVITPLIGLILFFIKNRAAKKYTLQ
ncbi:hypothetical protein BH09BAC3_BH09BAC3_20370 [soil metagenome]